MPSWRHPKSVAILDDHAQEWQHGHFCCQMPQKWSPSRTLSWSKFLSLFWKRVHEPAIYLPWLYQVAIAWYDSKGTVFRVMGFGCRFEQRNGWEYFLPFCYLGKETWRGKLGFPPYLEDFSKVSLADALLEIRRHTWVFWWLPLPHKRDVQNCE